MTALVDTPTPVRSSTCTWFQRIGALGALLALAILGVSMTLRIWTEISTDGQAASILSPSVEGVARAIHRVSATAVAILALTAVILCLLHLQTVRHLVKPVAWILASTVALAVVGPLTPGYRIAWITVLNVTAGMLLLMAFWWLRIAAGRATTTISSRDRLQWSVLVAFVFHIACGAASSAWAMHGVRWLAFVHLCSLFLAVTSIGLVVMNRRNERAARHIVTIVVLLLAAQMAIGYALMLLDARPLWLMLLHGMLSPLLALAISSLLLFKSDQRAAGLN